MRILLAILFGGQLLVWSVEARLGENMEQLKARYGKPNSETRITQNNKQYVLKWAPKKDWDLLVFSNKEYEMAFGLFNDEAEILKITFTQRIESYHENIIKVLKENSNGSGFLSFFPEPGSIFSNYYLEPDTDQKANFQLPLMGSKPTLIIMSRIGYAFNTDEYFWPKPKGALRPIPPPNVPLPFRLRQSTIKDSALPIR